MKRYVFWGITLFFLIITVAIPQTALAQAPSLRPTPQTFCPDPYDPARPDPDATYVAIVDRCVYVNEFTSLLLNLFILAGVLASAYRLSLGFFLFITAQGDPTKLQNAREILTEAIVGLLVVVGAWALIQFFEVFLPENWLTNLT